MTHYRIYLLGPTDKIISALDVNLIDDAQAQAKAASMAHDGQSVEVWQGARYICRLLAEKTAA